MRKNILNAKRLLPFFVMVVVLACSSSAFANATIIIVNANAPNVGFNDPTPAAPVGGNPGTTLGQQRLNAFNHAAQIWGSTLDSPVTIRIQAAFVPLGPGVLGSAGATYFVRDFGSVGLFPGAEYPLTWYFATLADKRAGTEIHPTPGFPDIVANFSSNFNFYLGLDNNHGAQNDLVTVLLHEFGHGLNFANRVDEASGTQPSGLTDIYARHTLDNTSGLTWNLMTNAQRQASAINFGNVVWTGANVTAAAPNVLILGSPEVRVLTPPAIAGVKQFGTAQFGPQIPTMPAPVSGTVVPVVDVDEDGAGTANTTTDGCTAPLNAAAIAGNIALVERGGCGFVNKGRIASEAGAIGVIIYNQAANAAAAPPGMAGDGVNDPFVTAPTVSLRRVDGLALVANPGATAIIGRNPAIRAGADLVGKVRLYMPNPVIAGSSGSHFDQVAFKNLLMEPNINADLTHDVSSVNGNDLTLELLRDVGWFADADNDGLPDDTDCEPNSNFAPTVVIGTCDSGVTNFFFTSGCTFSDLINHIAENSSNHGQFVSQTNHLLNQMKKQGLITDAQKDILSSCAGGAKIP
ncbi:MAG TPA: PA domain-containing protein [Pyrinomonadaceae bacterium]|nr:PA domain-containing protein [Pyrinomonadaceae bacterium]